MKPSKHIIFPRLSLVLIIIFLTMILAATALAEGTAQPEKTVQPLAGKTCVMLDEDFAEALAGAGISLGIVKPGFSRRAKVCFPISGGGIDLKTVGKLEITHTGGLSLTQDETTVELTTFIIDTLAEPPVLSGLVILNGGLVARLPLFELDLTNIDVKQKYKFLAIRNVGLTLTEVAANTLNGVFEFEKDLAKGDKVGVAKVFALLFRDYYDGCEI